MILYDNANQNIETGDLITFAKFYTKYITTKKKSGRGGQLIDYGSTSQIQQTNVLIFLLNLVRLQPFSM